MKSGLQIPVNPCTESHCWMMTFLCVLAVTSSTASAAGSSAAASSAASNFNNSQQGFMQRLVTDKSSAFRSHPLFPLLRDLIIADMNFHEPSFPHSLIRDLPSDFNKLLTVCQIHFRLIPSNYIVCDMRRQLQMK